MPPNEDTDRVAALRGALLAVGRDVAELDQAPWLSAEMRGILKESLAVVLAPGWERWPADLQRNVLSWLQNASARLRLSPPVTPDEGVNRMNEVMRFASQANNAVHAWLAGQPPTPNAEVARTQALGDALRMARHDLERLTRLPWVDDGTRNVLGEAFTVFLEPGWENWPPRLQTQVAEEVAATNRLLLAPTPTTTGERDERRSAVIRHATQASNAVRAWLGAQQNAAIARPPNVHPRDWRAPGAALTASPPGYLTVNPAWFPNAPVLGAASRVTVDEAEGWLDVVFTAGDADLPVFVARFVVPYENVVQYLIPAINHLPGIVAGQTGRPVTPSPPDQFNASRAAMPPARLALLFRSSRVGTTVYLEMYDAAYSTIIDTFQRGGGGVPIRPLGGIYLPVQQLLDLAQRLADGESNYLSRAQVWMPQFHPR